MIFLDHGRDDLKYRLKFNLFSENVIIWESEYAVRITVTRIVVKLISSIVHV